MKLKSVILSLSLICLLSACAGRPADPVEIKQTGDEKMTCATLYDEMEDIKEKADRLTFEADKAGKNAATTGAAAFFIVPIFFLDLSDAEKVEIEAYVERHKYLKGMWTENKCDEDVIQEWVDKNS